MRRFAKFAVVLFALASVAGAQVRGVPASVTSVNPQGFPSPAGIPASVTSVGPNGFSGCSGPLIPAAMGCAPSSITFPGSVNVSQRPPQHIGPHHHGGGSGVVFVPVYVPYPVAYEDNGAAAAQVVEEPEPPAPTIFERRSRVVAREEPKPQPVKRRETPREEPPAPEPKAEAAPVAEPTPTVLVFNDGRQIEVKNYAIVGESLYAFSDTGSRKIPLADLDVDATVKANDDRGVDFRIPGTRPKPAVQPGSPLPPSLRAAP